MIGLDLPVRARVNTVSVTERGPRLVGTAIGHATGLLTLKQKPNGTVLIGGGWQGLGSPEGRGRGSVDPGTLSPNLQLAQFAAAGARSLPRGARPGPASRPTYRISTRWQAQLPALRTLPARLRARRLHDRPVYRRLMGDLILGREPELPLFDPARFDNAPAGDFVVG